MTASVRDLLDQVHASVWELVAEEESAGRARQLMAAWPRLAGATVQAVIATPLGRDRDQHAFDVLDVLRTVARSSWGASTVEPHAGMVGIAARVGAVADLLVGTPAAASAADRAAAAGLLANVVAPVHAAAVATLAGGVPRQRRQLLGRVAAVTERYAMVPVGSRAGRFDDVAAVPRGEVSLEAAILVWTAAASDVLRSRHRVTGTAVQVAAADVAVLTAAAASVCSSAVSLGVVPKASGEPAVGALLRAQRVWRSAAAWPVQVRLGGVRAGDLTDASEVLRRAVADATRGEGGWLSPQALASRTDVSVLVATMRRGIHATGRVALAHYQAVDHLVRGGGRLWIEAERLVDPAWMTLDLVEAKRRRGWVPLPPGEATGELLWQGARSGLVASTAARAAFDRTASAPPTGREPAPALQLSQGRLVVRQPSVTPSYERVTVGEPRGAEAQRRALPAAPRREAPGLGR